MAFNKEAEALCYKGFKTAEMLCRHVIQEVTEIESEDGTHALFAAISTAGGALKTLAEIISAGAGQEGNLVCGSGNKETALVAGLAIARIMIPNKEGVKIDFS